MKIPKRVLKTTGVLLLSSFLFSNCSKEVAEDVTPEKEMTMSAPTNCKPVVMGAIFNGAWRTVMQKWYDGNGKLAYLKAGLHLDESAFASVPLHLEWGEVTYKDNQVYVKNVPKNDTIIRITVDEQNRPVASYYYYNYNDGPDDRDTSYYYFTGSRLDSIISLGTSRFTPGVQDFHKYTFSYDGFGNLVQVRNLFASDRPSGPIVHTTRLTYDYSRPVTDMLSLYMEDRQYKLLEYMDMLRIPIHHALVRVTGQDVPHFPWEFTGHKMLDNGLVYFYEKVSFNLPATVYTGWDCGSIPAASDAVNRQNTTINSLEDFQRMYPNSKPRNY